MRWHYTALAATPIDTFYVLSSTLFLLAFAVAAMVNRGSIAAEARLFNGLGGLLFVLSLAILVLISISFDFGTANYPSRRFPYLPCGRYLLGSLVPFSDDVSGRTGGAAGLAAITMASSAAVDPHGELHGPLGNIVFDEVFASHYNWYHLP